MLDCALDSSTVLNFMPIPLVQSAKLSQLPRYLAKDGSSEHNLDGVGLALLTSVTNKRTFYLGAKFFHPYIECLGLSLVHTSNINNKGG